MSETLLLIEKRTIGNTSMYTVHGDKSIGGVNFLKESDAFDFAKTLLNGGSAYIKTPRMGRGGARPRYSGEFAEKKRKFMLEAFKTPRSVSDLMDLAKKSGDKQLENVPLGTWSGLTSVLYKTKKLGVTQKLGTAYLYKTRE